MLDYYHTLTLLRNKFRHLAFLNSILFAWKSSQVPSLATSWRTEKASYPRDNMESYSSWPMKTILKKKNGTVACQQNVSFHVCVNLNEFNSISQFINELVELKLKGMNPVRLMVSCVACRIVVFQDCPRIIRNQHQSPGNNWKESWRLQESLPGFPTLHHTGEKNLYN